MKIKLAGLLLLGTTLAALPALQAANSPGSPGGERRERMQQGAERMGEALGLSEAQQARMKEIFQQEKAELDALRAGASGTREENRAKARAIHEKYREQRQAVMTPEQRARAEKMRGRMEQRQERVEKRKERRD